MACHRFFMKVFGFFMKALLITECYCNSKKQSTAPITAADGRVALMCYIGMSASIILAKFSNKRLLI